MIRNAGLTLTALLLAAAPAVAQEPARGADDFVPPDAKPLTPEESAQLAAALQFDPADTAKQGSRALKQYALPQPAGIGVTQSAGRDGANTYTVKHTLPALNASVGADLGTGAAPVEYYQPDRPIASADRNTGAAWASVDIVDGTSLNARMDPSADQGRLATTWHRSVPIGGRLSMTLQNSTGVTDSLGTPVTSTAPAGLPMMTLPQASAAATQTWDDQPSVKFDVSSTGTSLTAGLARTSTDTITHNRIGADQQLYGPLHVSTAISDVGETTESKSVSADLKFNW